LPLGGQIVRFSFPVISKRSLVEFGRTGVEIESDRFVPAQNVQDLNAIAYTTLDDKRLRLIAKQTVRLLAKARANRFAEEQFGPLGGLAANIVNAVTETADTRSWTMLPEGYYVTRVDLKPGTYSIKLYNSSRMSEARSVQIAPGKLLLLRDAS
jgi:uncharacterized protein